jgi:ABC-type transport system substrate-binding protein
MSSRRSGLWARWLSVCSLVFFVSATLLEAQPPEKQPPQKQPPQKPGRTEEEEDTKPAPAKQPATKPAPAKPEARPDRPVAPPKALKPPPQLQPITTGPFDLAAEAKKATNPEVKKLLEELTVMADEVTSDSGRVYKVNPIGKRYDRSNTKPLTVKPLTGDTFTLDAAQIKSVSHYEERAMEKVRLFLDRRLDQPQGGQPALSRFNQLRAAEMVLVEALKFHRDSIGQGSRDKTSWSGMESDVKDRLFAVRIDEVRALAAEKDYHTGEALSHRLFSESPGDRALLEAIEQFYVKQAEEFLQTNDYLGARLKIEYLRNRFRHQLTTPLTQRVIGRLEDFARRKFEAARQAVEAKDRSQALTALEEAEQAWPTLPGLREFRVRVVGEYVVLRVGVRNLPTSVSPITAVTDADKIACRLVYEPLLTPRYPPSASQGYTPVMTEVPHRISRGYEFLIPSYLKWSDGNPVKTDDILRSFEFLSKPGTPLYDPTYDNDAVFVINQVDESRFTVTFPRAAVLDPLSHLNFPILPSTRLPRDQSTTAAAVAFAKNPMGTGPYMFVGHEEDEMIFKANPHYKRPHLPEGPAIREIRFIKYNDFDVAKKAFLDGRWQMLLDASSKEVDELTGNPQALIFTPTETTAAGTPVLSNPRIYFLGFNYRKPYFSSPPGKDGHNARKAINMAINRDGILNTMFRGKMGTSHQPLNGPFPVNSWAYDATTFGQSPYGTVQASIAARSASPRLPAELKLIVLAEDEPGVKACEMIVADLAKAQIKAKVIPLPANSFFVELHKPEPDFDLVYTCYDFDNETLNVASLFDDRGASGQGRNFMNYQRETSTRNTELNRALNEAFLTRDIKTAERKMNVVHKIVNDQTLIVPLYQLDRHIAVHRSLDKYPRFHPVYVFEGVENWVLRVGGM